MSWIDDIENAIATKRAINREDMIVLRLPDVRRLISEARKMEQVREWFAEFGIGGWRDELRKILGEKDE